MYKNYFSTSGSQRPLAPKLLRIMRLTTVILLASLLQVSASSLAQRISIQQRNVSLVTILKEIRKQSGYSFVYNSNLINDNAKTSVSLNNITVEEALKSVLNRFNLSFEVDGKTVSIRKNEEGIPEARNLQTARMDVKGKIVGSDNLPLPGASIRVKGTNKAVVAGSGGEFSFSGLDENDILVISYIGHETQEIKVRPDLGTIKLNESTGLLSEVNVVNTGYQRLSKERSAGAFAKPDMQVVEDRSTSMNILQRIDGQIPGFTVNNAPLSQNPYLVRGLSTIGVQNEANLLYGGTSRNPLYVVDGIALEDLSSINPQDVADVTVLKDATAASIWGARAANGVIVITTKKGIQGDKIKIQYDGFINFLGKPDLDYMPVLNSQQHIQAVREIFDPVAIPYEKMLNDGSYVGEFSTGIDPAQQFLYDQSRGLLTGSQLNSKLDSLSGLNNRQQIKDLWYRNAFLSNQTLSVSGGGKIHTFYGALAYTNTTSPRPGERNNLYKLNVRQDFRFSDRIQAYLITDFTNTITSNKRQPAVDYRFTPYQMFQDGQGNNLNVNWMGYFTDESRADYQSRSRINLDYNPMNEVDYGYTKGNNWLNRITSGVTVNLIKGLRYEGVYGYVKGSNNTTSFDNQNSYLVRTEAAAFTEAATSASTPIYHLPTKGGRYSVTNTDQRNWTLRNLLIYDQSWNDSRHQLTLLAGQEAQDQLFVTNRSLTRGYDEHLQTYGSINYAALENGLFFPVVTNVIAGFPISYLGGRPYTKTEFETRFTSYFANAGYTFDRKYTLNASIRFDKSNLFGLDKSAQNRPAWSVGGKWLLSEEKFMDNITWVGTLALRATYGLTGNSPAPGSAASYNVFNAATSTFFPNRVGLTLAAPANQKLTWESTRTINVGLDFGLLNNRLYGSLDLYHKKTTDLLGAMPVNPFTGYNVVSGNYGNMQNKGIELGITSVNLQNGALKWSTTLNLAYNNNKITELNNPTAITTGNALIGNSYVSGYSAFALFAYQYAGLDNMGDPQIKLANGDIVKSPNAAKPEDMKYMGTYQPVWSGGLTNTFSYKNFRLSANVIYNLGHVLRNDVNNFYFVTVDYVGPLNHGNALSQSSNGGFTAGQIHPIFLERWKQPGDELKTNVPSFAANFAEAEGRRDVSYFRNADINVSSASYIKMRDITLSYSLPKSFVSNIKTENISLRMQVSNIMLWKANKHNIDPEFHDAASGRRVPSEPFLSNTSVNTTSYRYGQGTISFGINAKF